VIAEIATAARRPRLFEPSTAPFWDDPYIAGQLLRAHLDDETEAASRPRAVIDATVANLVDRGLAGPGRRVLDLGCGPGLYAHALAVAGCAVTGLDLSPGSIAYAAARANDAGLSVDYRVQDFLTLAGPGRYDLILQAYGELSTFPDPVRDDLLRRIRDRLAPGGALLFDVTTPAAHRFRPTTRQLELAHGGLWRPGPHLVITDRYDYPGDVTCRQFVVADDDGIEVYRMWFHDYVPATLTPVLAAAGFDVQDVWGSLTGTGHDPDSDWFAVLARAGTITTPGESG
jgi:SAM-dependent methyltransferase